MRAIRATSPLALAPSRTELARLACAELAFAHIGAGERRGRGILARCGCERGSSRQRSVDEGQRACNQLAERGLGATALSFTRGEDAPGARAKLRSRCPEEDLLRGGGGRRRGARLELSHDRARRADREVDRLAARRAEPLLAHAPRQREGAIGHADRSPHDARDQRSPSHDRMAMMMTMAPTSQMNLFIAMRASGGSVAGREMRWEFCVALRCLSDSRQQPFCATRAKAAETAIHRVRGAFQSVGRQRRHARGAYFAPGHDAPNVRS